LLGSNLDRCTKKFPGEVSAVRPNHGAKLAADLELSEIRDIVQWLKDRTVDFAGETNLPFRAIAKAQPDGATST
jgi:hypothetical protein